MKIYLRLFYCIFFLATRFLNAYDLTVIGIANCADGLGKIPIGLIDQLRDELKINFISTEGTDACDVSEEVRRILFDPDKTAGTVSLLTAPLFWCPKKLFYQLVPESKIKIAYSMFESTKIPSDWVEVLNASFDAVVVPDPFLVKVYTCSGVRIPIFVIPLGMDLDAFLEKASQKHPSKPFVFGASAAMSPRKNLASTVQAFAEEFGNCDDVVLKIHGRFGAVESLLYQTNKLQVSNILFSTGRIDQKSYLDLISSFDCYLSLSKGEGFSFCPREALAVGIPSIISDNTSHKTLCKSGYFKSVPSKIRESAYYGIPFYDAQSLGFQFNCEIDDIKRAMRDVYSNYSSYLKLARKGRQWVLQYSWRELKGKYLALVRPKKVILGKKNRITDCCIETNSEALYNKYKSIVSETGN